MKNILFFFTFFSFSLLFSACKGNEYEITDLLSLKNGKEVKVSGYFSADPVPMIVFDSIWLTINTPMPANQYIVLRGKGVEDFLSKDSTNTFFGAFVTIKGTISFSKGGFDRKIETNSIEINGTSSGGGA